MHGSTPQAPRRGASDTPVEVEYYRNGGIPHTVLRKLVAG